MAKLSSSKRDSLPSSTFAGPHRSFPIPDAKHARAALMDVGHAKGLSSTEKSHIRSRARAVLRRSSRGGRRS